MAETLFESITGAIRGKMTARICDSDAGRVITTAVIPCVGLDHNMRRSESLRTGLMERTDIHIIEICGLNEHVARRPGRMVLNRNRV